MIIFRGAVATKVETCQRCMEIGLPPNGIQIGETYAIVWINDQDPRDTCLDCFIRFRDRVINKISQELSQFDDDEPEEGEAWKQG